MPRKKSAEMPLPTGWDYGTDFDGKVYFIDHNTKKTTWIDPRDRWVSQLKSVFLPSSSLLWPFYSQFDEFESARICCNGFHRRGIREIDEIRRLLAAKRFHIGRIFVSYVVLVLLSTVKYVPSWMQCFKLSSRERLNSWGIWCVDAKKPVLMWKNVDVKMNRTSWL